MSRSSPARRAPCPRLRGGALRSGSFVIAGRCTARLTHVGDESYASRLTAEAQADGHKVAKGEMMRSLDKLIKAIGLGLIPVGVALFVKHRWALALDTRSSVESTVAALVGMIPEGLYLLTSVALAVGMIRLAQRRVLAQDMNCIETLARVDVLCVDKTGTITESAMAADEPVPLQQGAPLAEILRSFYAPERPENDTARALAARFGQGAGAWPVTAQIPFNTAYKYSAKTFGAQGSYVVGAPDVLAGARKAEFQARLDPLLAEGRRVLLLAKYDGALPDPPQPLDPARLTFLALLPLQNRIRATAPDTFAYFAGQGVTVKVISGDDPRAVSHVAAQAGIVGADRWADAAVLQSDADLAQAAQRCAVFGRVTPETKAQTHPCVAAAGAHGGHDRRRRQRRAGPQGRRLWHRDGVRRAGSQPGRAAGTAGLRLCRTARRRRRRPPRHQQHPALGSLFLVKNIFSLLLSLVSLCLPLAYPFQPLQLSLLSAVTIGLPSFVLALEPNYELVRGKFLHNVLHAALPGGLTDFLQHAI